MIPAKYPFAMKFLHWFMAMVVVLLFCLGLWMSDLDYYHEWYRKAPTLHVSVGLMFLFALLVRVMIRLVKGVPAPIENQRSIEKKLAKVVHGLLYVLMFLMATSGYLLASLEEVGVTFFNWFYLPSIPTGGAGIEDAVEEIHEICAFTLIGLAVVHMLAGLKHHFIDRDGTLKRMI